MSDLRPYTGLVPGKSIRVWAIAALLSVAAANAQTNLVITPSSPLFSPLTVGNTSTSAPGFPVSSWQAAATLPLQKQETYVVPSLLFAGTVTVDDIASISYWTNKPGNSGAPDWSFYIYTVKQMGDPHFYHSRLTSEPYFTSTPAVDDPPNQWHQWATNAANPMRFYDFDRNGLINGTYTDPTLATIQASTINWPAAGSNDYGPEAIMYFSLQTGSAWANGFTGLVDGVTITLKDGRVSTINLEAAVPNDIYQVRYFSNLPIGGSYINLTNTGASSTLAGSPDGQNGNICANVFTYSPDEQLISCCSCLVTPNGLASLSVVDDLISNTLTPIRPSSVVVKLVSTPASAAQATCNPAINTAPTMGLAAGLAAWGNTLHPLPVTPGSPATTYGATETPFSKATMSGAELTRMNQLCSFIQANGSGFGVCKACRFGGLGASKK